VATNDNTSEIELLDWFRIEDLPALRRVCAFLHAAHKRGKGFRGLLGGSIFFSVADVIEKHVIPGLEAAKSRQAQER
jgi:hypothetical protein